MTRLLHILLLLGAVTLLQGCTSTANRKLGPITDFEIEPLGSIGAELVLEMENRSHRNLWLREGEIEIYLRKGELLRAQLHVPACLEKRTADGFTSRWRLHYNDPTTLKILERRLQDRAYEELSVSYRLTIRWGGFRKTFSRQEVPLSEFLRTFDPLDF